MGNSGLEFHQSFSYMKANAVVLQCCPLWSKSHNKTNPIDRKLMKYIYLSFYHNFPEGQFVYQEYEDMQDEDEEKN